MSDSLQLARRITEILDDNKAEDIVILDVADHLWITDYFVIATGQSKPHIKHLRDEVGKKIDQPNDGEQTLTEGNADEEWLLSDFGDVITHIFTEDQREYYNLEGLWADAEEIPA